MGYDPRTFTLRGNKWDVYQWSSFAPIRRYYTILYIKSQYFLKKSFRKYFILLNLVKKLLLWRTCDKAGAPTLFACGEWYALRAWYCLRQWYALRAFYMTKANRISLRPSGVISLLRSKNITLSCARHITKKLYHPTLHPKGVTHHTLQSKACEKEYEQNARTPFAFFGR